MRWNFNLWFKSTTSVSISCTRKSSSESHGVYTYHVSVPEHQGLQTEQFSNQGVLAFCELDDQMTFDQLLNLVLPIWMSSFCKESERIGLVRFLREIIVPMKNRPR